MKGELHKLLWPVAVCTDISNITYILDGNGKIYIETEDNELHELKKNKLHELEGNYTNNVEAACHDPLQHYTDLAAGYAYRDCFVAQNAPRNDTFVAGHCERPSERWEGSEAISLQLQFDRVHQMAHKVEKLDEHGKPLYSYKGTQNKYQPQNAKTGPLGNVWISDLKHHRVQEFGPYGNLIGVFGSFGSTQGKFDRPHGITFKYKSEILISKSETISNDQNPKSETFGSLGHLNFGHCLEFRNSDLEIVVYVVDTGNQRVQKFGLDLSSGWPTPGPSPTPAAQLEILALSAQPAAFIAEDGQKTTISYLVTKPALVRLMVMDRFGSLVRDLGQNQVATPGWMQYITWDGRNNFGTTVVPDVYTIRAEATSGQEQAVATTMVTILAQGQEPPTPIPAPTGVITPVWTPTPLPTPTYTWTATPEPTATWTPEPELRLSNCHASPNPFKKGRWTTIHYILNMDAEVTINLAEKGGHDVQDYGPFAPGTNGGRQGGNQVRWDGDKIRVVHAAGHEGNKKYICKITARKGGRIVQEQFEITLAE